MNENDQFRLQHMMEAARDAIGFAAGRRRSDLDSDKMLLLSLVKCIEIIGEAANQVSKETRDQSPQISWPSIINMRHRLIHAYYDVNHQIVWQTVREDLPELVRHLDKLLATIASCK
jgi:uncharacterized protein with HEPN domain